MSIGVDALPSQASQRLYWDATLTNAGKLRQSAEDALFSELARQPASTSRGLSRATSPPPNISAMVGQQSPPVASVSRPVSGTQTAMPASMPEGYRVPIFDRPSTSPISTPSEMEANIAAAEAFLRKAEVADQYDFRSPGNEGLPPIGSSFSARQIDSTGVAGNPIGGLGQRGELQRQELQRRGKSDDMLALEELMRQYDAPSTAAAYALFHGGATPYASSDWPLASRIQISPPSHPEMKRAAGEVYDKNNQAIRDWQRQYGPRDIAPEVVDEKTPYAGSYRWNSGKPSIGMSPEYANDAWTSTHEQYHADQDNRYLHSPYRIGAGRDPVNNLTASAAVEFGPAVLDAALPYHINRLDPSKIPSPGDAERQLRRVLEGRTNQLPLGYLSGPSGAVIPNTWIEQQAARYGAFGPTARAKKLGFQGNERIPIEQLLNSDIGRSWFNHYMTSRPASQ